MESRHFPSRPIVGVGAAIVLATGAVVLVKRKHEPAAGTWSLRAEPSSSARRSRLPSRARVSRRRASRSRSGR